MPLVHLLDPRLAHGFIRRDLIYDLALSYFIITGKSTSFKTVVDSISKDNLGLKKQSRRGVLINVWSKDSEKKPPEMLFKGWVFTKSGLRCRFISGSFPNTGIEENLQEATSITFISVLWKTVCSEAVLWILQNF